MNVVIVYHSLFGNTRAIAEAIAEGARSVSTRPVRCTPVEHAVPGDVESADLLVVGGPTHKLGLSSRQSPEVYLRPEDLAAGRTREGHPLEAGADGPGLREWLSELPKAARGRPPAAAAFDTRLRWFFSGSAARAVHRRLRRLGYPMAAPAESFFVDGMEGPLRSGEVQRAREWGAGLVRTHQAAVGTSPRAAIRTRQRNAR